MWSDLDAVHAQHRRHVRVLTGIVIVFAALAIVVHPVMLAIAGCIVPFVLLELLMARQSRPTSRIPDYRPTARVDVELSDT